MNEFQVRLYGAEDAVKLVNAANGCDFDVDVIRGSVIHDAKSLLGVLSLAQRQPVTVRLHGTNAELESLLASYRIRETA